MSHTYVCHQLSHDGLSSVSPQIVLDHRPATSKELVSECASADCRVFPHTLTSAWYHPLPPLTTPQEQISSNIAKYGEDVLLWPKLKKQVTQEEEPQTDPPSPSSPDDVSDNLMYAIVHSDKPPAHPIPVLRAASHDSLLQFDQEWTGSESPSPSPGSRDDEYEDSSQPVALLSPPTGESSQDTTPLTASNQLTPPPSTPLGASLSGPESVVTNPKQNGGIQPQAILNALYRLSRTLSDSSEQQPSPLSASPRQQPFINDDVATAIRSLINSQTTTPPPTPLADRKLEHPPVSANDLVLALHHLVAGGSATSSEGGDYMVPQSTPREGEGQSGVAMEDLMSALSRLAMGINMEGSSERSGEDGMDGGLCRGEGEGAHIVLMNCKQAQQFLYSYAFLNGGIELYNSILQRYALTILLPSCVQD